MHLSAGTGLNPNHFPGSPGNNPDGSAHFGNKLTATEWAQNHGDTHGVGFGVKVPNDWLNEHVKAGRIDVYDGLTENHLEYIIPKELFEAFNRFPRFPWSGR
ncbi:hypothetical protein [Phytohabitans rumicis]|uniref:Uncharacterized protein n=1 Tax=Phytohabitans rumicis TaxID=1076125 RepID=A0A6V8KUS3_9ACTN|nr:hypothetical protein [Phytohabitans rumicis]GFJ87584.1 hypothetical protein Prum_012260 [Phytohabitans rumicis]